MLNLTSMCCQLQSRLESQDRLALHLYRAVQTMHGVALRIVLSGSTTAASTSSAGGSEAGSGGSPAAEQARAAVSEAASAVQAALASSSEHDSVHQMRQALLPSARSLADALQA